ncbi:MAG: hypothetical protein AAFQ57_09140, partial [Cyanobacteria bacterium J06626_14]
MPNSQDASSTTNVKPQANGNAQPTLGGGKQKAGMFSRQERSHIVEKLSQALSARAGDRQLILIQDFPDPDALSSAWTYKLICQNYDIDCDIYYGGTLSHQENIALVRLTGLPARRWTPQGNKQPNFEQYQGYVLIDTQGTTSQMTSLVEAAELPLFLVIDHHAPQRELSAAGRSADIESESWPWPGYEDGDRPILL